MQRRVKRVREGLEQPRHPERRTRPGTRPGKGVGQPRRRNHHPTLSLHRLHQKSPWQENLVRNGPSSSVKRQFWKPRIKFEDNRIEQFFFFIFLNIWLKLSSARMLRNFYSTCHKFCLFLNTAFLKIEIISFGLIFFKLMRVGFALAAGGGNERSEKRGRSVRVVAACTKSLLLFRFLKRWAMKRNMSRHDIWHEYTH